MYKCSSCQRRSHERPGSTGFIKFSSELNVTEYPFKKSNSLLNKGRLFKGKNLLLKGKFFPLRVDPIFNKVIPIQESRESHIVVPYILKKWQIFPYE